MSEGALPGTATPSTRGASRTSFRTHSWMNLHRLCRLSLLSILTTTLAENTDWRLLASISPPGMSDTLRGGWDALIGLTTGATEMDAVKDLAAASLKSAHFPYQKAFMFLCDPSLLLSLIPGLLPAGRRRRLIYEGYLLALLCTSYPDLRRRYPLRVGSGPPLVRNMGSVSEREVSLTTPLITPAATQLLLFYTCQGYSFPVNCPCAEAGQKDFRNFLSSDWAVQLFKHYRRYQLLLIAPDKKFHWRETGWHGNPSSFLHHYHHLLLVDPEICG